MTYPEFNLQAHTIPPLGPVPTDGCFGYWFTCDIDARAVAIEYLENSGFGSNMVAQIWDTTASVILGQGITASNLVGVGDPSPNWRKIWLHPRVRILASTPYLLCVSNYSAAYIWRYGGILSGADFVNGHVRALSIGPDSFPGGRYDIPAPGLTNPPTGTTDNLYSVDVLLEAV
jgi:hypothetical protein